MKNREIVDAVASNAGLPLATAEAAVAAALEAIRGQVAAGKRVELSGFGVFEARDRAARMGRNPQTGESMQIPANRVPVFRAALTFRRQVSPSR